MFCSSATGKGESMQQLLLFLVSFDVVMRRIVARAAVRMMTRSPGQGLVEYGLILVLVMVVCVVIIAATGETVRDQWYAKLQAFPTP
jgi:Flp pilus assembly pilin Flp